MFGSLILPPTIIGGAGAGTRITTRRSDSGGGGGGGGGGIQRDHHHLSNYHPTMSNYFPSRNKLLPRTRWRIRASSTTTTTTTAASDTTPTLPSVVELSSKPNNLYQILGIKQNASSLEIKTAYRKLAKQFHPDALPPPPTTSESSSSDDDDGARDFMAIHNAYATLSDPTERARYDLSIQIHTRIFHRYYSSTSTAVDGNEDRRRRRSYGIMQTTRRWETDQCW